MKRKNKFFCLRSGSSWHTIGQENKLKKEGGAMKKIAFFKIKSGKHRDERREITEVLLPEKISRALLKESNSEIQCKVLAFAEEGIHSKISVGNHYHTIQSNRYEFFVAVGDSKVVLFHFYYRTNHRGRIYRRKMYAGDGIFIPPNHSHTFVPIAKGAKIFGFANQAYDSHHDVSDALV